MIFKTIRVIYIYSCEVWANPQGFQLKFACNWNNHSFSPYIYVQVLPVDITRLPLLEKLYLDNNKLYILPPELGDLKNLKVLRVDYNMLVSVPGNLIIVYIPLLYRNSISLLLLKSYQLPLK